MFTRRNAWGGLIAIVFVLLALGAGTASAGQLTLAWNANTESNLAGYKLRIGNASGVYQTTIDVHNTTTYTATGLTDGQVYYFTVTAYNTSGAESAFSAEVSGTVGGTAPPPTGLVAAYGFDEGTGTSASDGSGNGNAGSISGATWAATGRFGKALSFNGTSSRVIVADAPALDLTTGMTLEAWLNPTALSAYRSAILKETSTALSYSLYANNNAPKPASTINVGGSDKVVEGTAALALNTWTHLASTYDGATVRIFVNGVQISTLAASGSMTQSTGPLSIGGNGIWGEFFSGLIDEVRVYNRALSATEIQADMGRAVVGGAPADTTAPTVSISAPAAGSVTGTVNVTANASDNVGVAGVQFLLDGANLGAEDLGTPYTTAWDTTTATNGTHTLTAVARDAAGNTKTSTAVSVTVSNDSTAPVISGVTASAISGTGATIGWTTSEASDSQVEYGPTTSYGTLTTLNASMVTTHSTTVSGLTEVTLYHYRVRSKDATGNLAMSADATFTTRDATAPTVSVTGPATGATVSATVTVTASASDNVGVAGVQFMLDGASLGAEDLSTPYSKAWDTTTATNGAHTLTAVARDAAGNTKTSTAVSVTVNNDSTAPVISSVTASAITGTGATIGWTTSEASDSQVEYGPTASYGTLTTLNASMVTTHSTAVSGLTEVTLYHYRVRSKDATGNLALSADATFTTKDATAPAVSITSPAASATVSATITVTASASDNVGVTGVQFLLDGANLGAEDLSTPFTMAWDTTTATNGAHTLTAVARDAAGNTKTSTAVSVTVSNDSTAPAISGVTASAITGTGATIGWTTSEASDSQVEYGPTTSYGTLTTLNASMVTTHSTAVSGLTEVTLYHYRVRSKDASGNLAMSADATFTTKDATAPAVSITSPAASATVSATITVTASASDNVGVAGVQFLLDGANLGTEDLATPYTKAWDTTTATNGTHTLTAVARDAAGNTKTSTAVSVTVSNDSTAPAISGVTASAITATGATIGWTTTEASDSQVEYGLTASYGTLTTLNASMVTTHSTAVSGLAEATLYHYRVRSKDATGNLAMSADATFTTRDATAPVISGVTASAITGTGATIGWTTSEASDSQVEYGPTTSYGTLTTLNASMVTTHSTAVSGLTEVTLYHYRVRSKDATGNLAMSADATFTTKDATAPAVSITSPAASATVSATITVTASASDNVGVTGVQFLLDGANLGTEDLGTPYTKAWDTTTATNGTHTLTAVARDAAGNTKTSTAVSVTVSNDSTAPLISGVTASAITTTGATIGWTTSEASDSQVEYGLTASYGTLTTLNASMVTTHSTAVSGLAEATLYHYRVRSKDATGNLAMSADATFTTRDVTAPTVSMTSPTAGALLSATVTVSASASDNLAVAGVQFKLDGAILGTEDTATPYTKSWDTKTASNGPHTLTAVARDAAGNVTTSPGVIVTVFNDLTAPGISHVLVSSISAAGATISWQSDEAGDSQIEYGLTTAYGSLSALNGSLVLAHAGTLTGLTARSQYHFRVRSRDVTGNLATSGDFTFGTRDGAPPVVSLVSPLNGSTVTGTTSIQASATDNVGVAGVSFNVDGVALGAELTSTPYTIAWDTTGLSDGTHVITAVARDASGDATTSAGVSVTVNNGILWLAPEDTSLNIDTANYSNASVLATYTWPDYEVGQAIMLKFDLSALPAGAVVNSAALNLALVETDAAAENTYNVSAHKITGRQPVVSAATGYTADGVLGWTPNACCYNSVPLAQANISPAYDTRAIDKIPGYKTWDLTQVVRDWAAAPGTNRGVLLNADTTARQDRYRRFASMEYADQALHPFLRVSFTRASGADTVPPAVSMTAPAIGATVTGVATLSASATDNVGVAGVQFKVDGIALGAERTAAPYATTWDTSTVANGAHTLVAVARDAAGNMTGSTPVSVIVANSVAKLTPQDTYLNLNTTNYATATTLATYTWPDYQVANAILMKFDLSSLPAGAVIQEAVLSLALVSSDSTADPNYTISIHKVVGVNPVLTAATGSKAGSGNSWAPSTCCYNGIPMAQANISAPYDTEMINKTPGFKTWTITEMVRDWLANPGTNSGLLLNSDATALRDRYRYFASSENPDATLRPFLTIRYVQP